MSLKIKVGLLGIGCAIVLGGSYLYFQALPKPDFSNRGESVWCSQAPIYSDYPSDPIFTGEFAKVSYDTNKRALDFQPEIDNATASGKVNFSGKYLVIEKTCGIACQDHAVIDVSLGKIMALGLRSTNGVAYKQDSSLLAVNPGISPSYYQIKEDGFHYVCETR